MDPIVLVIACTFSGLSGALAVTAAYHRRQAAGVRALLQRLEELAETTGAAKPSTQLHENKRRAPTSDLPSSLSAVTADVLAGRTTHVRELLDNEATGHLSLADQAVLRIYAHLREPISPSALAQSLNLSLRSLERGLGMALDCTPRELILAVKMREARRLLTSGELNVTGVAYRLGFSSPSHFSKRFREFFRRSPSDVIARRVA